MPIFEYQCQDCNEVFESLQLSRSRDVEAECPHCGSDHTERMVSSFATSGGGNGFSVGSSCGPSGSGFS
jgi:putative FmdB family regulatory protein